MAADKKVNWTEEERDILVAMCQDSTVATGKFSSSLTAMDKVRFGANVAESVNSVSKVTRTIEQIKKKWIDLKSQTKKKTLSHIQEVRKTGGGPAPILDLKAWESKVLQAIPSCSIEGIENGTDTFLENNVENGNKLPDLPVGSRTEFSAAITTEEKSKPKTMCESAVSEGEPEPKKARFDKRNAEKLIAEQTQVLGNLVNAITDLNKSVNALNSTVNNLKQSVDELSQQL